MVQRRRQGGKRKNASATRSAISRVASGVPISKRNIPRDPPMLPHVLAYPVRTRFLLRQTQNTSAVGYAVFLSGTPTGLNYINHYFNPTTGVTASSGGLSFNEVFTAAAMRLFGVDVTADPGGANFVTTDYAIQKVVMYGPSNSNREGGDIMLTIDYGGDIPGFVGRDSPARNRRAAVSSTPPRLSWRKLLVNNQTPVLNYSTGASQSPLANNSGVPFPTSFISSQNWEIGVIDVTVLVRRSVITDSFSALKRATDTVFTSD